MDQFCHLRVHSFNIAKGKERKRRNYKKNSNIFRILCNKKISLFSKKIVKKRFKRFKAVKERCKKYRDKLILFKISSL